jgi:predicted ribosome quality control (RQC) complex YloA/Tae2 family protein
MSPPLRAALSKLGQKKTSIENELAKVVAAQRARDLAALILANLHVIPTNPDINTFQVLDFSSNKTVTIELPPPKKKKSNEYVAAAGGREGAKVYADALFLQSRKGKRGEATLTDLITQIAAAESVVVAGLDQVEESGADQAAIASISRRVDRATKGILRVNWANEAAKAAGDKGGGTARRKKAAVADTNCRVFSFPPPEHSATHRIFVGRNRRQNEHVSFRVAKPGDVWLHARGRPGAHVVVKANTHTTGGVGAYGYRSTDGGQADVAWEEAIQFGADLAAFYSDFRTEAKAEIVAADPKHVLKPKGAPLGAVKLREGMDWTVIGNPFRVPRECVESRAMATGMDDDFEFGPRGKTQAL